VSTVEQNETLHRRGLVDRARWFISLAGALWLALLAARVMEGLILFTDGNLPDGLPALAGYAFLLDTVFWLQLLPL
jgi:hypothetical protein